MAILSVFFFSIFDHSKSVFFVDLSSIPLFWFPLAIDDDVVGTRDPIEVLDRFEPLLRSVFSFDHLLRLAGDVDEVTVKLGRAKALNERVEDFSLMGRQWCWGKEGLLREKSSR